MRQYYDEKSRGWGGREKHKGNQDCRHGFCFADLSNVTVPWQLLSRYIQDISSVRPQSPEEALWLRAYVCVCVRHVGFQRDHSALCIGCSFFSTVLDAPITSHLEVPFYSNFPFSPIKAICDVLINHIHHTLVLLMDITINYIRSTTQCPHITAADTCLWRGNWPVVTDVMLPCH